MTTDNFQIHWPEPKLENTPDATYGHSPQISYGRDDGQQVAIRVYEDGAGRLIVSIHGTQGTDIVLEEDADSHAAVTVDRFDCPTAAQPLMSDQRRILTRARELHCGISQAGQHWYFRRPGGITLAAQYSPSGRLVHGCRQPSTNAERRDFVGADKADQFIDALAQQDIRR